MKKPTNLAIALSALIFCGTLSGSATASVGPDTSLEASASPDFSPNYSVTQPVAEEIALGNLPGYVGQIPDQEHLAIDLYIYGEPSEEVQQFIESHREVTIKIRAAKHSLVDLEHGNSVLGSMVKNSQIAGGVKLKSFQIEANGSGISIGFDRSGSTPDESWVRNLELKLGVTVLTFLDKENIRELSSRANDSQPWHGGSFFKTWVNSEFRVCSMGFGVTSTTTDIDYLLTARHCFTSDSSQTAETLSAGRDIGKWSPSTYYNFADEDLSLVFPIGDSVSSFSYNGPFNTSVTDLVSGTAANTLNQVVCVNGGNTGRHCDITVTDTAKTRVIQNKLIENLVQAKKVDNTIVVGDGDSGSPVVSYNAATPYLLRGNGLVYAGAQIVGSCSSSNTPNNRDLYFPSASDTPCYRVLYFTDLSADLSASHMRLK